tara:strand:- start:110 stop:448 length:339 start_codon:yes stop_codon:yes gene_type:complete
MDSDVVAPFEELESLIIKDIEANAKTNNEGSLVFYWNDIKDWGIADLELDENGYETHAPNDDCVWLHNDSELTINDHLTDIEHDNIFYWLDSDYNEDKGCLTIFWEVWDKGN